MSDADALIESLEQLITKKRHLKQGAMQELLTGKKRLPGFGGEWEVKRLRDLGYSGGLYGQVRDNSDFGIGSSSITMISGASSHRLMFEPNITEFLNAISQVNERYRRKHQLEDGMCSLTVRG